MEIGPVSSLIRSVILGVKPNHIGNPGPIQIAFVFAVSTNRPVNTLRLSGNNIRIQAPLEEPKTALQIRTTRALGTSEAGGRTWARKAERDQGPLNRLRWRRSLGGALGSVIPPHQGEEDRAAGRRGSTAPPQPPSPAFGGTSPLEEHFDRGGRWRAPARRRGAAALQLPPCAAQAAAVAFRSTRALGKMRRKFSA